MNKGVEGIAISGIRRFYEKVSKVEGAISLTLGQPDFNVPISIKEEIINSINNNETVYTSNIGVDVLREKISEYLKTDGIEYSKGEIMITVGGSEGLFNVFTTLLNKGDKILIPTPGYPAYESISKIIGATPIEYSLNEDFTINIEEVRRLIKTEEIKYLVLSFPTNPTGAILTKENLEDLKDLVMEEDVVVITDEIYSALTFDNYLSVAQVKELKNNIIYLNGFSKMFSATGLRLGYVAASEIFMKELIKVHQYNVSCPASIIQYGVARGFEDALKDLEIMKESFIKRRDYVYNRLINMELQVVMPKGAFYIFPSIKKFNLTSDEFCTRLLNEKKVAIVPGTAFGTGGEGYIRISYCYSDEQLKLALDKLEEFITEL